MAVKKWHPLKYDSAAYWRHQAGRAWRAEKTAKAVKLEALALEREIKESRDGARKRHSPIFRGDGHKPIYFYVKTD